MAESAAPSERNVPGWSKRAEGARIEGCMEWAFFDPGRNGPPKELDNEPKAPPAATAMGRQRIGPRARARTRTATTTKSSRARKQPAQWLSAGATTKKNDESSSQLKRLEIRKFCANTRELERLNSKECGAVLAADAVNERANEVFTLPK